MNRLEIFEKVYGPTEWSESALTALNAVTDLVYAEAKRELTQPLTDPENQPSQFGTVTLEMYEALENSLMQSGRQIEMWMGRYFAKEGELDQLKADLRAMWNNRDEGITSAVANLLIKHGLGDV